MKNYSFLVLLGILSLLLAGSLCVIAQTNKSIYATEEIENLSITAEELGSSTELKNSFYVGNAMLNNFAVKFKTGIDSIKNDVFNVKGEKLQINYIQVPTEQEAEKVYKEMIEMVGNYNVIALKGNIVVEVITTDISLKEKVIKLLDPEKNHRNY